MIPLGALWLPIVLSAVAVFLMSSIIHMVVPWHKNDYPKLARQDELMDAVRPLGLPPGDYMVPRATDRKEMASPEFAEKLKRGPVMILTVLPPGGFAMGRRLGLWFLYCLVVGISAACLTKTALGPGATYSAVFKLAGSVAFIGYALALYQMSIWYNRAWSITLKTTVDGVIYALLTGGVFGWLWPNV